MLKSCWVKLFAFCYSWVMGYSCSQTQGSYLRISVGCEFRMGEFPRCGGWNLVRSGTDSSSNMGTDLNLVYRTAHYPFSKWHVFPRTAFQPLETPSSLQALTGFCWSPTWLFKEVYILIALPVHVLPVDYSLEKCQEQILVAHHCTVTPQRCLSLLYRSGDEVGGSCSVSPGHFSISEVPCFPFVLGILWSVSKSLLGCGYPTGPSKKPVWTPGRWNGPCWVMCRLEEVFFFSCWLVISSLSFSPPSVLVCEVLWFLPLA